SRRLPGEVTVPVGQERIVSIPQSGLIDTIHVATGQMIKKGDALAHVVIPELIPLQREYLQALSRTRLAAKTMERDAELYRDGIIAERRYLAGKNDYEEIRLSLTQSRRMLELAGMEQADIEKLEGEGIFESGMTIRAPVDGQLIEQMITAGERIEPATPLFRIAKLNPLWLKIRVPVELVEKISAGMAVLVPRLKIEGRVTNIIRSVNRDDQTMYVRAVVDRDTRLLSPGQFVEAEIVFADGPEAHFSVPKSAVVRNGPDTFIFIETEGGFIPARVAVVSERNGRAVIYGDRLTGTERIAVTGTIAIKAVWLDSGGE
ncbi:MAG TPA: efflux RND transporter periplasmic adaptor subunit, partial [Acidobacteriota bacterium]|nr:efflux RND transporter periplasmic adaptor subunit [Acidobacteriota bacterium]